MARKRYDVHGDPPGKLGWCVPCYGALQVIEIEGDERPELVEMAESHVLDVEAKILYKGRGECIPHFNIERGFPADYPAAPLDEDLADRTEDEYEVIEKWRTAADRRHRRRRGGRR
jgi:hypothetical protein